MHNYKGNIKLDVIFSSLLSRCLYHFTASSLVVVNYLLFAFGNTETCALNRIAILKKLQKFKLFSDEFVSIDFDQA